MPAAAAGSETPAAAATPAPTPAEPVAAAAPWYLNPYLLVGGLLLVLGGLVLVMRRSKAKPENGEPAPRRLSDDEALRASIAKTREAGEKITPRATPAPSPSVVAAATAAAAAATAAAAAAAAKPVAAKPAVSADPALDAFKEAVRAKPQDLEAHLSLLRLYHSRGNAAEYEIAAQAMRAQLPSTTDPRWREAVVMGASLLPGQALFSQAGWNSPRYENEPAARTPAAPAAAPPAAEKAPAPVKVFDKPVEERKPAPAAAPKRAEPVEEAMDLDNPNLFADFGTPPTDVHRSEAQLMVEDEASATRIELAKAYLAIGDLDGARSMLEEVLAEGGPSAQSEAARILKEIG
jgi:pilus assembly protein FimV